MASSFNRHAIIFCMLVIIIHVSATVMSRPQRNDVSNMADALKYLQELDSYYSNVARPRQIRSDEDFYYEGDAPELQTAIQLLRLETIDRIYSKHTRPRFGKRAKLFPIFKDHVQDDFDLDDWQSKYLSRR